MKSITRLSLMGSGLGLILLMAMPSFATVLFESRVVESPDFVTSEILNLGGNGNVVVTPTNITFSNSDTNTGTSSEVGAGTTLTIPDGTVIPGNPVEINGGAPIMPSGPPDMSGAYPVDVPVYFPSSAALSLVAREMSDPIGTEFGMTSDEIVFGLDVRTAIENLHRAGQEDRDHQEHIRAVHDRTRS